MHTCVTPMRSRANMGENNENQLLKVLNSSQINNDAQMKKWKSIQISMKLQIWSTPTPILKSKANCSYGGWWSFKWSKTAITLWRYNVFHSLGYRKKKTGVHVSTKLVKSGLCLSRRPHNNLIALPFSDYSGVKPLLFYFHYELPICRSDKCCDCFVKLSKPLSCILESSFSFWKCFHILTYPLLSSQ